VSHDHQPACIQFDRTAVGFLEIMSDFEEFIVIGAGGENLGFQKQFESVTEQKIARAKTPEILKLLRRHRCTLGIIRKSDGEEFVGFRIRNRSAESFDSEDRRFFAHFFALSPISTRIRSIQ
jgi:hypothetical protein